MDKIWLTAFKTTGAVGVIAYILDSVIQHLFDEKIVDLFGSDRMFSLVIGILACTFIILFIAVLKFKSKASEKPSAQVQTKEPKVVYKDESTHNGNNVF